MPAGAAMRALPAIAFIPALLLPFASLPMFEYGQWGRAEPVVIAVHAAAALGALVLLCIAVTGRIGRTELRLALPAIVLVLWSMAGALRHGTLLTAVFGAPQSGLGVLWYLDLAIWLVLAAAAVQTATVWRRLTDAAAMLGWCLALAVGWGRLSDEPLLIFVTAYYAWPALALPAMLLAHPGGPVWRLRVAVVLGAAVALLVAAGSNTFALAAVLALAGCILVRKSGSHLRWVQSRGFALGILAVAAVLPFCAVALGVAEHLGASMRARVLVMQVVLARLREQGDIWLTGLGWGRTSEVFATHLDVTRASLWDYDRWDFLTRDYFHSHNLLTETALAAGLPGLLLAVAICAVPIWFAPEAKRPYATAFAAAWLLCLGVWFELAFTLPVFALAVAACCHDGSRPPAGVGAGGLRFAVAGLSAAAVAGLLVATACLVQQAASTDRIQHWLAAPAGAAPELMDVRQDDRVLAAVAADALQGMKDRIAAGQFLPVLEALRLSWMIAALDARIPQTDNPSLTIVGDSVLAELMLNPELSALRATLPDQSLRWPRWLNRVLALAPGRSDVAVGYLTWCFTSGNHQEVVMWARRLRVRDPDDPVGLYFEGGVYAMTADPQLRRQGIDLLRRALDHGVDRYIPLDETFKAQIRRPAG